MNIMKTRFILISLLLMFLGIIPTIAQGTPDISSFTSPYSEVERSALTARTARIPVSWRTIYRPLTSNLVFEQVFPDGSTLNVELPRAIPWVNSSADGVVAPILPDGAGVGNIRIRVSLISLLSDEVLDTEEIVLIIVQDADNSVLSPAITHFNVDYSTPINRASLNNGTVRLPVSWEAINRPTWANLVFEQVLADGTVHNVELPRPNNWVNSSGQGIVAPISVGDSAQEIVLRVRLADFFRNGTYDQFYALVPIVDDNAVPDITSFKATYDSISRDALNAGNNIEVSWAVINRPSNSNLVFEQVLPDGTVRNAELPRDVEIITSQGYGAVDPIVPNNVSDLVFQVRLIDLGTGNTLDTETITVDILDDDPSERVVVTGDACFQSPFPESTGVTNGAEVRVQYFSSGANLYVYNDTENYDQVLTLEAADTAIVESDPYCMYYPDIENSNRRMWFVDTGAIEGWIDEYAYADNTFIRYVVPSNQSDLPTVSIQDYTMTPQTVSVEDLESTEFTFTWQTTNADKVSITPVFTLSDLGDGSTTVSGSTFGTIDESQLFVLIASDSQNNIAREELILTVTGSESQTVTINSFSADRTEVNQTEDITFTWDITGTFTGAYIDYNEGDTQARMLDILQGSSSATVTIPAYAQNGDNTATLTVIDTNGREITQELDFAITCQFEWDIATNDSRCPLASTTSAGAYQSFERGFTLWSPTSNNTQVIVTLYNDGTAKIHPDHWDGTEVVIDGTPPESLFAPERGFGYLWNTVPEVRSSLGWATASEQSYTVTSQSRVLDSYRGAGTSYYTLPDGRVIGVDSTGSTYPIYTWRYVE